MALCWQFEILSVLIAMPLTALLLLSGSLLFGRMVDVGMRRAKEKESHVDPSEHSSA